MAKKSVKKSTRTKVATLPQEAPVVSPVVADTAPASLPTSRFMTYGLIALAVALLVYKFGPYFVPAMVGNKPVSRFAVWNRLEKSYGSQTLDDLVNEAILDKAIAQAGIKVEQSKIDAQLESLEKQFESMGGLDAALTERGLAKQDLIRQITTQLSVEELLADKINPSEEEIKQEYEDNKAVAYKDKKFDDVKAEITLQLKDAKLREEFLTWFGEIKKSIKVKTFGL